MDVNQPKSRSFNMYLRYFQMGLQVLIASKISQIDGSQCKITFQRLGFFVSITIIVLNIIAMIVTRCAERFPRIFFFVFFIINLILAVTICVLGIIGMQQSNSCANNKVLHRFVVAEAVISIVLAFLIMFLPFHWIQRYSNTPGNLAWIFLFFGFPWTANYKLPMMISGVIAAVISGMSLFVNLIACNGITTKMKKIIVIQWIFGAILMLVGQILMVYVYIQHFQNKQFMDHVATKVFQTFAAVNILDLFFWLYGYLTLQYENGDKIRDQLMRGRNDQEDSQNVEPYEFNQQHQYPALGTIKH